MKFYEILMLSLVTLIPSVALAGGCPENKSGPTQFEPVTETSDGVFTYVFSTQELGDQTIDADGWKFRARTITIPPKAQIALHSHEDRPETVTMKYGALSIYEENCTVGYAMKEGETYQSGKGDSHWAVNETDDFTVMYVVDLVKKDSFPK